MKSTDFAKLIINEKIVSLLTENLENLFNIELDGFIGSHPIGLNLDNKDLLLENNYYVCEKTDGIRVMLYVTNHCVYLYDRLNRFYLTDYRFKDKTKTYLFDGEMFKEEEKYYYYIFDTLIFESKNVIDFTFDVRLGYAKYFAMKLVPLNILVKKDVEFFKFNILFKQMIRSYYFDYVLKSISKLKHENDGLIFTPVNEPYELYTQTNILKWKPPSLNTLDFLVEETEYKGIYKLYGLLERHQVKSDLKLKNIAMTGMNTKIFFDYFNDYEFVFDRNCKVYEFVWDDKKETLNLDDFSVIIGGWKFHKKRTDKSAPNNIKILYVQIQSLKDVITDTDLLKLKSQMQENYEKRKKGESKNKEDNFQEENVKKFK